MIEYAHSLGHSGICFTEHESITSSLDALQYYKDHKNIEEWEGFKVALGNEIYLCTEDVTADNKFNNRYPHFILVALNANGHKGIRELSTKAWTKNSFMHVMMRVPTYYSDLEEMMKDYKGDIVGSSACFRKGTQVETKDGWKSIEDIKSGDLVMNRYGEWEKVIEPTTRYYKGCGYKIEIVGNETPIICTANHQFLTVTNNRKKPKWVEAEKLNAKRSSTKDILLYPCVKKQYTQNKIIKKSEYVNCLFKSSKYGVKKYTLPEEIVITPEIMRMFGLFLGDGNITLKKNCCVNFAFNEEEFDVYYNSFIKQAGEQLNIKWNIAKRPQHHRVNISSGCVELIELFYYLFGDSKAETKYVPDRLRISEELDYELVFGYLLADGYFRVREGNKKVKAITGEFVSVSTSHQLSRDFYAILSNMGITTNMTYIQAHVDKNGCNHKDSWYLQGSNYIIGQVNKKKEYSHKDIVGIFEKAINIKKTDYTDIEGIKYRKIRIKNKEEIRLSEQVFCLNNTTHSFKCENVIVHNCLGGALPHRLLQFQDLEKNNPKEYKNIWQSCKDWIEYMNEIFGKGYFFIELQPSYTVEQVYVNRKLLQLSKETDTPHIITTDAHYLKKEDRKIHKIYLESQDGDREVDDFYATTYLMSEKEIHEYMDDYLGYKAVQNGLDNTMLIYNMVEDYSLTKELDIPYLPLNTNEPDEELYKKYKNKIELLEYFYTSLHSSDRHLVREIISYIDTDEYYQTKEGYEKINECLYYLKVSSEKMNVRWSRYLLQIAIDVQIAWEAGTLVGAGRGSGVGFCLLHILGITQINPLREKTQTFPWRFMNPERASVLDIDIDICGSKREKVIRAMKDIYGEDRVSKVMTLSTEKSRSAILTAARGLKIDNDIAQYISSLIVSDRGQLRTLSQMYYGDEDNLPIKEFVSEMDKYPELWEVAQKIEGLVNGVGSHAGGIILVDKPFTESTALMKTNSGDIITQFDLHMCEKVGLIKVDLLCIDALDKMQVEIDLLLKENLIEWQGSLKTTYEKYLGVYTLEREAEDMWKMLWEHKVMSFFQMEKESGVQAVALAKPTSVDELATINSVLRLMSQEKGTETPLQKYARFRKNIQYWYDEMSEYGLTQEEQNVLKNIIGVSFGICEAQEYLVLLTQHPQIGGFSLEWGDRLRKAVAKKKPKEFLQLQDEFFNNAKEKNLSNNLVNYVWNVLISTQRGYGFNKSHTLAYSIIGLQELNLCYKYNPIFWQTANLIVDSGAIDENAGDATNYGKMATAIASVQKEGVKVELPLINSAEFGFKPDVKNNRIIFGLKGINGIGDDVVQTIICNRPFVSLGDFAKKTIDTKIITKSKMVQLIKGGCFTELHSKDRRKTMDWFLKKYAFTPCEKITMQQFDKLKDFNEEYAIIPKSLELPVKFANFKKYVLNERNLFENHIEMGKKIPKRGYHDRYYILDSNSQPFFTKYFTEDSIVKVTGDFYVVSEKEFTKEVDSKIQPLKKWFDSEEALNSYNNALYQTVWSKYAEGSVPYWSMQSLSFYDEDHELENINEEIYGIVNFFDLPEDPQIYDYYTRYIDGSPKQFPKFKICRIVGTVINADNLHYMVTLLTKYGAVKIKFNKGQYAFYNKQISVKLDPNSDKKTVLEKSWLTRGSKIIVAGVRIGDNFKPMVYKDTIYQHTVNRIQDICNDGTLLLQSERTTID